MKKTLLLSFLLFCCTAALAQSYVYHPFPATDAMWRENSGEYTCNCCREYQLTIAGDTIIGATTFHKLNWGGIVYMNPNPAAVGSMWSAYWGCSMTPSYAYLNSAVVMDYAGAFRENVASKKVYFVPPGALTDTLLYDFNLNVGDTLPMTYTNDSSMYPRNTVHTIDSVLVGGVYHKRFNLSSFFGDADYVSIIEGVGSTFGFLGRLIPVFESASYLNCFAVSGVSVYPSGTGTCEPLPLSINDMAAFGDTFTVYPNPGNGKFNLNLNSVQEVNSQVTDILGNVLFTSNVKSRTTEIDISDQAPGIYFLKLSDTKGNSVTKKIVKQ